MYVAREKKEEDEEEYLHFTYEFRLWHTPIIRRTSAKERTNERKKNRQ